MKVELLHHTPLYIADKAIAKCWDKEYDDVNYERIKRVGIKFKHASTLEHINYTFDIDGISRACLQELARHRHTSLSVKSTRYTLKELKNSYNYVDYIVHTGNEKIDEYNRSKMVAIQNMLKEGIPNDIVKYMLPEAYKTSLVWTINMRSLRNFLSLRTDKSALWEIRRLASNIFQALPMEHKYLFVDTIKRVSSQMRAEHFMSEGSYAEDEEILEWYRSEYAE